MLFVLQYLIICSTIFNYLIIELRKINYIKLKHQFYDDILSSKRKYYSNLIPIKKNEIHQLLPLNY